MRCLCSSSGRAQESDRGTLRSIFPDDLQTGRARPCSCALRRKKRAPGTLVHGHESLCSPRNEVHSLVTAFAAAASSWALFLKPIPFLSFCSVRVVTAQFA